MSTQHVIALGPADPLPAVSGLPEGYAVLHDGVTHVVRAGVWEQVIFPEPTTVPIPDEPDQPTPTPSTLGLPTKQELEAFEVPIIWRPITPKPSAYDVPYFGSYDDPDRRYRAIRGTALGGPTLYSAVRVEGLGATVAGDQVFRSIPLATRPGFYEVQMQVLLASNPGLDVDVVLYTAREGGEDSGYNGPLLPDAARPIVAVTQRPGKLPAVGGGVIYVGDRGVVNAHDPHFTANEPIDIGDELNIEAWINHAADLPDDGYDLTFPNLDNFRVQVLLRPLLFTGPDNPPVLPTGLRYTVGASGSDVAISIVTSAAYNVVRVVGGISAVDVNTSSGGGFSEPAPAPPGEVRFTHAGTYQWEATLPAGHSLLPGEGVAYWWARIDCYPGGSVFLSGRVGAVYDNV